MEAAITNFMAITGCENDEEARRILLMYDNDINRAVDRYFTQKNRALVQNKASSSSSSSTRQTRRNDAEEMDTTEPGPSHRRPLPRRAVTVRNSHPAPSAPNEVNLIDDDDDEGIRRPIAPVTGQLVNESFQQSWRNGVTQPTNGIFQATTDFRTLARQQQQRDHVVHHHQTNGRYLPNGLVERKQPKTLQSLFQSPTNLMFIGPWEAARHQAQIQNQWLLVNLQNNSEFACACLNRDVWNKEMVQELVKKNFVFWQVADDSPDCKRVSSYYNVTSFPAVLIIDPRTGESICTLTRIKDTVTFLEELMEFLERYPDFATFDQSFVQDLGPPGPSISDDDVIIEEAAVSSSKKQGQKRKHVEDEHSVSSSGSKRSRISEISNGIDDVNMGEIEELCSNGTKLTTVDREEWRNYVGPAERGSQTIQIMFKFPNNDREKIEIPDTTQIRALFVFLDGRGLNSRDHVLVLTYPRREYYYDRHSLQTLRQLGFNRQELIHVDRK